MQYAEDLLEWFRNGDSVWFDHGDAVEYLAASHPRTMFVKSLRRHAVLLDVGAGNGSLEVLRDWPSPCRRDLKFLAYAMDQGERFCHYDQFELGEWPNRKPTFDNIQFDAIVSSHFIEHIDDPDEFIDWMADRLQLGGRVYVEWPSEVSLELPESAYFRERDVPIMISNFFDDNTHKQIPERAEVCRRFEQNGMRILQQGTISNPFVEQELLAHHKLGMASAFDVQSAFWSHTGWAQFVVASKAEVVRSELFDR